MKLFGLFKKYASLRLLFTEKRCLVCHKNLSH